jgi:hypothetical protein
VNNALKRESVASPSSFAELWSFSGFEVSRTMDMVAFLSLAVDQLVLKAICGCPDMDGMDSFETR